MKPTYTGQRTVSNTDRKFRPQDEHLLEKNKEELDQSEHGDKTAPDTRQNKAKFSEIDRTDEKKK